MNLSAQPKPSQVPTLTEVVGMSSIDPARLPVLDQALQVPSPAPRTVAGPELGPISEAQLAHRVLVDVQKQIDSMLDFRLREAIAPLLTRHSEALVRDLREELTRTMRDVVTRSVAQEVAKLRSR